MTDTLLAPAPAPPGTRYRKWCQAPIMRCPVQAEGYVTGCRGWVHDPPPGREHGRHYCGIRGTSTQAAPGGESWSRS